MIPRAPGQLPILPPSSRCQADHKLDIHALASLQADHEKLQVVGFTHNKLANASVADLRQNDQSLRAHSNALKLETASVLLNLMKLTQSLSQLAERNHQLACCTSTRILLDRKHYVIPVHTFHIQHDALIQQPYSLIGWHSTPIVPE